MCIEISSFQKGIQLQQRKSRNFENQHHLQNTFILIQNKSLQRKIICIQCQANILYQRIINTQKFKNKKMISEYLFKGIDNVFQNRGSQTRNQHRPLTKQLIKANLHTVIKGNNENTENVSPLKKSRLRTIIDKNRQSNLRGVIRRDNSRSASPYQKIISKNNTPKNQEQFDKIVYYREQRKTIEKSRVLEKSRMGTSNSRIFRVNTPTKLHQQQSITPKKKQAGNKEIITKYQYRNPSKQKIKTKHFNPI